MNRSLIIKTGWAVAGLMALGAAGLAARETLFGQTAATDEIEERIAQPVRVTRVALTSADRSESYTGLLRPQYELPLAFRLPGKLVARLVDVGDRVKAGQVVARLDASDARLQLEAAEAELAAARTDLVRAEADARRSRDLFAAGHVARAELDRVLSAEAEALSRADRARQNRSLAANQLSYTELVAEMDGIVTATLAEVGQVVAAGQPVLSVAREGALDVVFALPEQQRDLLQRATASAEIWGHANKPYALTLRDVSPDADPQGRTYRVRMTLIAPDAEASFGRTVTVRLRTAGGAPAMALPLAAVISNGTGAGVWRLPPGADHVERVAVEVVAVQAQLALVRGPLEDGDTVISLGAQKIDPARAVRVVETAPTPER
jgi:multidrug efflux system membrane fusion protein